MRGAVQVWTLLPFQRLPNVRFLPEISTNGLGPQYPHQAQGDQASTELLLSVLQQVIVALTHVPQRSHIVFLSRPANFL